MRQVSFYGLLLLLTLLAACNNANRGKTDEAAATMRIAFGSCADQDKPQPLLHVAANLKPDAFIFLGDNIYGDSRVMDTLQAKYNRLAAKPEFQHLWNSTKVYSIWDDHDYGENDAGRHYPFKAASKAIFMDFWEVPATSGRRKHEGIYGVEYLEKNGKKIQLLLLDTRTFRDDLLHRDSTDLIHKNDYAINDNPDSTILGQAQWRWLEQQLTQPADVRIIASSIQFSHQYNGWESWTNVPHEQQRMIDLIQKTKANGVIFISGDVHWGEISKMEVDGGYPIYDVTSSGINQTWDIIEPNAHRIGKAIPQNNVGLIEVTFSSTVKATLSIVDSTEQKVMEHVVDVEGLRF
jgi:alkaline phosphatase D